MSQSLDQLSLEELRSQLAEIQFKIEEKEKQEIIEDIRGILTARDLPFLRVLRKNLAIENLPPAPAGQFESFPSPSGAGQKKKPLKTGAYLRNGKVYLGIQEIKYVKYDKNNILRISKEGKGLPPRVDAFPDEIREALLALPLRTETTEIGDDLPGESSDLEPQEDDSTTKPSALVEGIEAAPPSPPAEEPESGMLQDPLPTVPSAKLDTPVDSTEVPPTSTPRPRRVRTKDTSDSTSVPSEKPSRPAPPEPLQVSLF